MLEKLHVTDMIPACDLDEAAAQVKIYLVTLNPEHTSRVLKGAGAQNSNSTRDFRTGFPKHDLRAPVSQNILE